MQEYTFNACKEFCKVPLNTASIPFRLDCYMIEEEDEDEDDVDLDQEVIQSNFYYMSFIMSL